MARVRYLGWEDREPARAEHGVVTAGGSQQVKSIHVNGKRLVFRGRSGKPSQWRTLEDKETLRLLEQHEDYEVKS